MASPPSGTEDTIPPAGSLGGVGVVDGGDPSTSGTTISVENTLASLLSGGGGSLPIPKETRTEVYVGDGLPPVPAKVAARIVKWDFVEMQELLPETLGAKKLREKAQGVGAKERKGYRTSTSALHSMSACCQGSIQKQYLS